jgi:hypothetical protein
MSARPSGKSVDARLFRMITRATSAAAGNTSAVAGDRRPRCPRKSSSTGGPGRQPGLAMDTPLAGPHGRRPGQYADDELARRSITIIDTV